MESSPDGILIVEDERITFVNAAAVGLFGANGPGQLLGRPLCESLDAESQASVREHLSGWRADRTALRLDAKIVRPDGTIRDIDVTGAEFGDWGLETFYTSTGIGFSTITSTLVDFLDLIILLTR